MGESFAERVSEAVASGMGSVPFIVCSTAIIIGWICLNAFEATRTIRFDPYPFILLNLAFSAVAFFTGALVIIAAKATAKRDRASAEADALHREELAAEQMRELKLQTEILEEVHRHTGVLEQLVSQHGEQTELLRAVKQVLTDGIPQLPRTRRSEP